MPLFGRRNPTPKKERRKSNSSIGNATASSKHDIVVTPNKVTESSPRRNASPFRFRRRDKHNSEETDSDTTSSTIHNNHHKKDKQTKSDNQIKKKKSLGGFLKRKSKKGDNVEVEDKDKTPKSRSRKSLGKKPPYLDSISNEPRKTFFISSPSARTTPKGKRNRKSKQSFSLENLNSPSSRTHDSMNSNITSSSLQQYPPSKLPTTIYSKNKHVSSTTSSNSALSRAKKSYQLSTYLDPTEENANEDIVQSDSIRFDDDNGDDESETKSVDTQQYAEYQNVLHQLKAKMMKDKDDEKKEFDLINEEDEDDEEEEADEIIKATFLHRDSSSPGKNDKDNVSRLLSHNNKSKFKLWKKRTLSPLTTFL